MTDFAAFWIFGSALLAAVLLGEALRAWVRWRPENSRRVVHAVVGVLVALCPLLFERPDGVYLLAAGFVGVNLVAVRHRFFPGMHGIARRSWGTVTFPLALLVALYLCWTLDPGRVFILQAAFLVLALADPLASLVGMSLRRPGTYRVGAHEKSVAGSGAFFGAAFVLAALAAALWGPGWTPGVLLAGALAAAACATVAEALGAEGWDNLLIVLAVVVPLAALHGDPALAVPMVLGVLLAALFALVAFRVRFLDLSGVLAASLLAFGVLVLGGVAWAAPAFAFFVLSSLLSRAGARRKAAAERLAEKSSRRDAGQVLANGGVSGVLLAATVFAPASAHPALYWAFVVAFAAAAADTWGTEVGTYFRWPTREVLTGRRVPPGTSGGVSLPGTLGALAGAAAVWLAALPFAGAYPVGLSGPLLAALVVGGGFAAALFDSALGASVQARYRDADGTLTERAGALPLARGLRWVTNDRVNLACTGFGAFVALAVLW